MVIMRSIRSSAIASVGFRFKKLPKQPQSEVEPFISAQKLARMKIAKSSPNSWSERELDQQEVAFNKDKDIQGPVSIAAVATIKYKDKEETPSDVEKEGEESLQPDEDIAEDTLKPDGRLAVFGDSDFAANTYFNFSGNGNFFLNTLNWLTEEEDLISIQPKTSSPRTCCGR